MRALKTPTVIFELTLRIYEFFLRLQGEIDKIPSKSLIKLPALNGGEKLMTEKYQPRGIGQNWLACFVCDGIKDGYQEIDDQTHEPTGAQVPSVRAEDGIHYSGGYHSCQPDMAAFVEGQEAGQKVVELFGVEGSRAFLDFRPSEPNWVQVKVGACEQHVGNLQRLQELTTQAGGMITREMIAKALGRT